MLRGQWLSSVSQGIAGYSLTISNLEHESLLMWSPCHRDSIMRPVWKEFEGNQADFGPL